MDNKQTTLAQPITENAAPTQAAVDNQAVANTQQVIPEVGAVNPAPFSESTPSGPALAQPGQPAPAPTTTTAAPADEFSTSENINTAGEKSATEYVAGRQEGYSELTPAENYSTMQMQAGFEYEQYYLQANQIETTIETMNQYADESMQIEEAANTAYMESSISYMKENADKVDAHNQEMYESEMRIMKEKQEQQAQQASQKAAAQATANEAKKAKSFMALGETILTGIFGIMGDPLSMLAMNKSGRATTEELQAVANQTWGAYMAVATKYSQLGPEYAVDAMTEVSKIMFKNPQYFNFETYTLAWPGGSLDEEGKPTPGSQLYYLASGSPSGSVSSLGVGTDGFSQSQLVYNMMGITEGDEYSQQETVSTLNNVLSQSKIFMSIPGMEAMMTLQQKQQFEAIMMGAKALATNDDLTQAQAEAAMDTTISGLLHVFGPKRLMTPGLDPVAMNTVGLLVANASMASAKDASGITTDAIVQYMFGTYMELPADVRANITAAEFEAYQEDYIKAYNLRETYEMENDEFVGTIEHASIWYNTHIALTETEPYAADQELWDSFVAEAPMASKLITFAARYTDDTGTFENLEVHNIIDGMVMATVDLVANTVQLLSNTVSSDEDIMTRLHNISSEEFGKMIAESEYAKIFFSEDQLATGDTSIDWGGDSVAGEAYEIFEAGAPLRYIEKKVGLREDGYAADAIQTIEGLWKGLWQDTKVDSWQDVMVGYSTDIQLHPAQEAFLQIVTDPTSYVNPFAWMDDAVTFGLKTMGTYTNKPKVKGATSAFEDASKMKPEDFKKKHSYNFDEAYKVKEDTKFFDVFWQSMFDEKLMKDLAENAYIDPKQYVKYQNEIKNFRNFMADGQYKGTKEGFLKAREEYKKVSGQTVLDEIDEVLKQRTTFNKKGEGSLKGTSNEIKIKATEDQFKNFMEKLNFSDRDIDKKSAEWFYVYDRMHGNDYSQDLRELYGKFGTYKADFWYRQSVKLGLRDDMTESDLWASENMEQSAKMYNKDVNSFWAYQMLFEAKRHGWNSIDDKSRLTRSAKKSGKFVIRIAEWIGQSGYNTTLQSALVNDAIRNTKGQDAHFKKAREGMANALLLRLRSYMSNVDLKHYNRWDAINDNINFFLESKIRASDGYRTSTHNIESLMKVSNYIKILEKDGIDVTNFKDAVLTNDYELFKSELQKIIDAKPRKTNEVELIEAMKTAAEDVYKTIDEMEFNEKLPNAQKKMHAKLRSVIINYDAAAQKGSDRKSGMFNESSVYEDLLLYFEGLEELTEETLANLGLSLNELIGIDKHQMMRAYNEHRITNDFIVFINKLNKDSGDAINNIVYDGSIGDIIADTMSNNKAEVNTARENLIKKYKVDDKHLDKFLKGDITAKEFVNDLKKNVDSETLKSINEYLLTLLDQSGKKSPFRGYKKGGKKPKITTNFKTYQIASTRQRELDMDLYSAEQLVKQQYIDAINQMDWTKEKKERLIKQIEEIDVYEKNPLVNITTRMHQFFKQALSIAQFNALLENGLVKNSSFDMYKKFHLDSKKDDVKGQKKKYNEINSTLMSTGQWVKMKGKDLPFIDTIENFGNKTVQKNMKEMHENIFGKVSDEKYIEHIKKSGKKKYFIPRQEGEKLSTFNDRLQTQIAYWKLSDIANADLIINRDAKFNLEKIKQMVDDESYKISENRLLNWAKSISNWWKATMLSTFGYMFKLLTGTAQLMFTAGMRAEDVAKEFGYADKIFRQFNNAVNEHYMLFFNVATTRQYTEEEARKHTMYENTKVYSEIESAKKSLDRNNDKKNKNTSAMEYGRNQEIKDLRKIDQIKDDIYKLDQDPQELQKEYVKLSVEELELLEKIEKDSDAIRSLKNQKNVSRNNLSEIKDSDINKINATIGELTRRIEAFTKDIDRKNARKDEINEIVGYNLSDVTTTKVAKDKSIAAQKRAHQEYDKTRSKILNDPEEKLKEVLEHKTMLASSNVWTKIVRDLRRGAEHYKEYYSKRSENDLAEFEKERKKEINDAVANVIYEIDRIISNDIEKISMALETDKQLEELNMSVHTPDEKIYEVVDKDEFGKEEIRFADPESQEILRLFEADNLKWSEMNPAQKMLVVSIKLKNHMFITWYEKLFLLKRNFNFHEKEEALKKNTNFQEVMSNRNLNWNYKKPHKNFITAFFNQERLHGSAGPITRELMDTVKNKRNLESLADTWDLFNQSEERVRKALRPTKAPKKMSLYDIQVLFDKTPTSKLQRLHTKHGWGVSGTYQSPVIEDKKKHSGWDDIWDRYQKDREITKDRIRAALPKLEWDWIHEMKEKNVINFIENNFGNYNYLNNPESTVANLRDIKLRRGAIIKALKKDNEDYMEVIKESIIPENEKESIDLFQERIPDIIIALEDAADAKGLQLNVETIERALNNLAAKAAANADDYESFYMFFTNRNRYDDEGYRITSEIWDDEWLSQNLYGRKSGKGTPDANVLWDEIVKLNANVLYERSMKSSSKAVEKKVASKKDETLTNAVYILNRPKAESLEQFGMLANDWARLMFNMSGIKKDTPIGEIPGFINLNKIINHKNVHTKIYGKSKKKVDTSYNDPTMSIKEFYEKQANETKPTERKVRKDVVVNAIVDVLNNDKGLLKGFKNTAAYLPVFDESFVAWLKERKISPEEFIEHITGDRFSNEVDEFLKSEKDVAELADSTAQFYIKKSFSRLALEHKANIDKLEQWLTDYLPEDFVVAEDIVGGDFIKEGIEWDKKEERYVINPDKYGEALEAMHAIFTKTGDDEILLFQQYGMQRTEAEKELRAYHTAYQKAKEKGVAQVKEENLVKLNEKLGKTAKTQLPIEYIAENIYYMIKTLNHISEHAFGTNFFKGNEAIDKEGFTKAQKLGRDFFITENIIKMHIQDVRMFIPDEADLQQRKLTFLNDDNIKIDGRSVPGSKQAIKNVVTDPHKAAGYYSKRIVAKQNKLKALDKEEERERKKLSYARVTKNSMNKFFLSKIPDEGTREYWNLKWNKLHSTEEEVKKLKKQLKELNKPKTKGAKRARLTEDQKFEKITLENNIQVLEEKLIGMKEEIDAFTGDLKPVRTRETIRKDIQADYKVSGPRYNKLKKETQALYKIADADFLKNWDIATFNELSSEMKQWLYRFEDGDLSSFIDIDGEEFLEYLEKEIKKINQSQNRSQHIDYSAAKAMEDSEVRERAIQLKNHYIENYYEEDGLGFKWWHESGDINPYDEEAMDRTFDQLVQTAWLLKTARTADLETSGTPLYQVLTQEGFFEMMTYIVPDMNELTSERLRQSIFSVADLMKFYGSDRLEQAVLKYLDLDQMDSEVYASLQTKDKARKGFNKFNDRMKKAQLTELSKISGETVTPDKVSDAINRIFMIKDMLQRDSDGLIAQTDNGRPIFKDLSKSEIDAMKEGDLKDLMVHMYESKDFKNPTVADRQAAKQILNSMKYGTKSQRLKAIEGIANIEVKIENVSEKNKAKLEKKANIMERRDKTAEIKDNKHNTAVKRATDGESVKVDEKHKEQVMRKLFVLSFEYYNGRITKGEKNGKKVKFNKKESKMYEEKAKVIENIDKDLFEEFKKDTSMDLFMGLTKEKLKEHSVQIKPYHKQKDRAVEALALDEERKVLWREYNEALESSKVFDTSLVLPDGYKLSYVDKNGDFSESFKDLLRVEGAKEHSIKYLEEFTKNGMWNSGATKEALQALREDNSKIMRQLTGKSSRSLTNPEEKVAATITSGIEWMTELSGRWNETIDNRSRFAMYMDGRKRGYSVYDAKKRVFQNLFNWNQVQHTNVQRMAPFVFSTTMMTQMLPMYIRQVFDNPEKFVRLLNAVQLTQASQGMTPSELSGIQNEETGYEQYTSAAQYGFAIQGDTGTIYSFKSHTPLEFINALDQAARGNFQPLVNMGLSGLNPAITKGMILFFGYDPYTDQTYGFGEGERIMAAANPQTVNALMTASMALSGAQHFVSYLGLTPEQKAASNVDGLWTQEQIQTYANHFAKRFMYIIDPADQKQSYANMLNQNIESLADDMGLNIDEIQKYFDEGMEIMKNPELSESDKEVKFAEKSQELFNYTLPYWTAQSLTKLMGVPVSEQNPLQMASYNLMVKSAAKQKGIDTVREAKQYIDENE